MSKKAVQISVKGKVQGVGYRYFAQKSAENSNVKGFVKNMPDGSVFIEAEGEEKDVDTFIDYCKAGPNWARVTDIVVNDSAISNYSGFEVRY
ncbi:MAG: acylphosphatase [Bacteroidales bacterium]